MVAICQMCATRITKDRFPGVKCGGSCENMFHISCAQISKPLLEGIKNRSASWLCVDCRDSANHSIVEIDEDVADSANNINLIDIMNQLKRMEKKLSSFDELKNTIESIKMVNRALNIKVKNLENQIAAHNNKLNQIDANIDKSFQTKNETNIVIKGLPLKHGDISGVIINTIAKIGVTIQTSDIISIEPVRKYLKINQVNPNKTQNVSHDFFVIKLKSLEIKNNILHNMKKFKTLSTKDLDVILPANHPEQRIFIMHHLTAFQSQLYGEAKKIKIKYQYKYLWCKGGQIYLRKLPDSDVYRIHSFNDLFRLEHLEKPKEDSSADSNVIVDSEIIHHDK